MKSQISFFKVILFAVTINAVIPVCVTAKKSTAIVAGQKYRFYSAELLKKSKITYRKSDYKNLLPTDLVQFNVDQYAISPLLFIIKQKDGNILVKR